MRYLRIVDWAKLQHYKDRNPPWIKLHTDLLDNYKFACLPDASKLLHILLSLLASRTENQIPYDLTYIKEKLGLKAKPTEQMIQVLIQQELLEVYQVASKPLAECLPRDRGRDREETEKKKIRHLECVDLTLKEHTKLIERFGAKETKSRIERLNNAIMSKGYKYKSHYHTILNWAQRDGDNGQKKKPLYLKETRNCSVDGCQVRAVWKSSGGAYDHWYCGKHIPKKAKQQLQDQGYDV